MANCTWRRGHKHTVIKAGMSGLCFHCSTCLLCEYRLFIKSTWAFVAPENIVRGCALFQWEAQKLERNILIAAWKGIL